MRRTFALFGTQLMLWVLVAQLNHALTPWRVYVFVGALFVVFAALTQPLRPGLGAVVLSGLLCDANAPLEIFGTQTLLFTASHLALYYLRDRVPREQTAGRVIVALLLNLALFALFSVMQLFENPAPFATGLRLLVDLLCSQLFLGLMAPWFFALQARALVLVRAERADLA